MPVYTFECSSCKQSFERTLCLADYQKPQDCPSCQVPASRVITPVGFILQGDGWPGKALRVKNQMLDKRERLADKEKDRTKGLTLAPNVEGERVDSWSEARNLAASKGKDTSTYDPYIRQEAGA